jgi:DNA-binding transcriptional LysR family regulator
MGRDVDLKRIRYFMTVHRLRSFSKASKELNIAQPALSRHIQALEHDLKVELLVRTSHGVDATIITPFDDPPKSQFVAKEELVLVSSKPRGVSTLELEQIASVPLLTSIGLKTMIERFAKPCGAKFHYMVELNSMVILKDMVMRGVGDAILPYAVVRNEIDSGRLFATRIVNPTITRDLVVTIRPEVSNRAPAVAFKNEVEFVLAELEREIGPRMSCASA